MKINRHYGVRDDSAIKWKKVDVVVDQKDGKFEQSGVEVPEWWSDNAAQILATKYFRKAGVPLGWLDGKDEPGVPSWLCPREPNPSIPTGGESSAKQVFYRLASCWTYWAWRGGYISDEEDARALYHELYMMLALQVAAPNSPQWFNTGLHWAYGIEGPASGQWTIDWDHPAPPYIIETQNAYERPQPHACFIQPVADDLVNFGGIMDLWTREVRLFKYGSGTGTNFSNVRALNEKLSGGGRSSGLMSFLRIGDRAAGAIKSGGTTRRAAKMVIVDADHPEVEEFIDWKMREEYKAAAMAVGSQNLRNYYMGLGDARRDPYMAVPDAMVDRMEHGIEPVELPLDWECEVLDTVSGQNSNNSVRVTNQFMDLASRGGPSTLNWSLTARTTGEVVKSVNALELLRQMSRATWAAGDPGIQFHDTINEWHTCPADGPIRASNPCSEYMFLDNTACNLASLNLVKFLRENGSIDCVALEHATRIWQLVLDVSIQMASFPSQEIALGSYNYRTTGLGYMNLGALLMRRGLAYDSDEGRDLAAAITALMTGVAYRTSAEMADELGPFPRWDANAESFHAVMRKHHEAIPSPSERVLHPDVWRHAKEAWEQVLKAKSFRNAQTTLLAPTGTISFVCDCDTFGIEPDFALVKRKHLAGGGSMDIVNQSIGPALKALGYDPVVVEAITSAIEGGKPLHETQLKPEHAPVFHTIDDLSPMAHVKMVGAVQPFLSGAVSKTVNLPRESTIDDVLEVYLEAWKLGVKAIAPYRDGSKLNQPLAKAIKDTVKKSIDAGAEQLIANVMDKSSSEHLQPFWEDKQLPRGVREYPPWRREGGFTQKVKIGHDGHSIFLVVNSYPDGRPCEAFLEIGHEGSTLRSMANVAMMMMSVALQYGAPVEEVVDRLIHTKFEPAGLVEGHDRIRFTSSITDFVGRELAITFLGREEEANSPGASEAPRDDAAARPTAPGRKSLDPCPSCGNFLRLDGTCRSCDYCGWNSGCGGG